MNGNKQTGGDLDFPEHVLYLHSPFSPISGLGRVGNSVIGSKMFEK